MNNTEMTDADEVVLSSRPGCIGQCDPGDLYYIHESTARVRFRIVLLTGGAFNLNCILDRGVYKACFETLTEGGFRIEVHSNGAEGRMWRFFRTCCGARVMLELAYNASRESILEVIADLESEPTYYDPIGMKYGFHEDHSDGYGIVLTRNNVPPPAGYEE